MKKIYIVIAGTLLAIFVVYLASMQSPQDPEMRRLQPTRKALAIFPGGRLRILGLLEGSPQPQPNQISTPIQPRAADSSRSGTNGTAVHPPAEKPTRGRASNNTLRAKSLPRITRKDHRSKATEAEVLELLAQVGRDMEPWKTSGISLEMVEKAYCMESIGESMRIQVVNGRLYVVGEIPNFQSRSRTAQLQLMELQRDYQLPDVDFILTTSDKCKEAEGPVRSHDGNQTRCQKLAPLFTCDKLTWEKQCVLAPDWSFGGWPEAFMVDWEAVNPWLSAAADARPWKGRHKPVYWRGGDTNTQRKIVSESGIVQDSDLTDVHLMSWGDDANNFKKSFKSLTEHCDYRHLLHLTGRAYSARLKYLLLCGSTVIFPHRGDWEYHEFWFHLLKDRENILYTEEVNWDNWGEPVLRAMKEVQANETWAHSMAESAKYLAAEVLHPDNIARYWMELLTQYSALQTFKPKVHADAYLLEEALLRPPITREIRERTCLVC